MPDRPLPIRVPCEGSGYPITHPVGVLLGVLQGTCPACGCLTAADHDLAAAHDRNDVAAMVARGDFG